VSTKSLSNEYGIGVAVEDVLSLEDGLVVAFCNSDACSRNGVPNNRYCGRDRRR
jgi:hypothetical protein